MMSVNKYFIISGLIAMGAFANAQTQEDRKLDQSVQVVRDYAPTVADAVKMNQMPVMDDTATYRPSFRYSILDRVSSVTTKPELLGAARMNYRSSDILYRSFLRGGVGNYSTIGGDYTYNIAENNDYHFSFNIGHKSSVGRLKLEDGRKHDAPFHDTEGGLSFKYFFDDYTLSSNIEFDNHQYRFYGLQYLIADDDFIISDPLNPVKGSDLYTNKNERWTGVKAAVGFANNLAEDAGVDFNTNVGLSFFNTKTGVKQNGFDIAGGANFGVDQYRGGIDASVQHFKVSMPDSIGPMYTFNERSSTLLTIKPHVDFDFDRLKLRAGIAIVAQIEKESDEFYLMPDVTATWNVADEYATFYATLKGDFRPNSYRSIIEENPFVSADVNMKASATPIDITGGVRARFSPVVNFNASVGYSVFTDEHFFVNKIYINSLGETQYSNKFVPIYDDGSLVTAKAELTVTPGKKTLISAFARYYGWSTDNLDKAWHKNDSEFGIAWRFYPVEKLLIDGSFTLLGKRYALDPLTSSVKTLKMVSDFSVGGEYLLSQQFSIFMRLNNIIASDYYRWNGYPSHGINVFAGLTFSF